MVKKIKWVGTLSTTERNNIGLIQVRQNNVNSEVLGFNIVDGNGEPYDLKNRKVLFCTYFDRFAPVEQYAEVIENGKIVYTMNEHDMQKPVRINFAYFKIMDEKDNLVDTTQNFSYDIIPSIESKCMNAEPYIIRLEEVLDVFLQINTDAKKELEQIIIDFNKQIIEQQQNFDIWFESIRHILESVDPGGLLLSEIIEARNGEEKLNVRLTKLENNNNERIKTAVNRSVTSVFGVIRKSTKDESWEIITDNTHQNLNIKNIEVVGNALRINFDFPGNKVGTFSVTNDEYMSSIGYTAGASVGVNYCDIYFYKDLDIVVKGDGTVVYVSDDIKNLIKVEQRNNLSGLTIKHPKINDGTNRPPEITQMPNYGNFPNANEFRTSWTDIETYVLTYSQLNGSAFFKNDKFEINSNNLNMPTVNFDSITGNITVTHIPINNDTYSPLQVQSFSGIGYDLKIISVSDRQFVVKFYNNGLPMTKLDEQCRFTFTRGAIVPSKISEVDRFVVKRGKINVPAADVITGEFGNFWLSGLINT